jgi:hypothetical protein
MLQLDGAPSYYSPIEYVPLQKLGSLGSPYISSVPSKFSVVLNEVPVTGQPDAVGGSKVLLNGSVRVASHMIIYYREAIATMTLDTGVLTIPSEYARILTLMVCCDLAGSYGLELGLRQEFRALLTDAMNLALVAEAGNEPTPAMRSAAASQGTVPPALFSGIGGIP